MSANWSAWFGIASPGAPYWEIETEDDNGLKAPRVRDHRRRRDRASGRLVAGALRRRRPGARQGHRRLGGLGRNGGGCRHALSPLFREEQRLWPMMDELLGYPTEYRPSRVRIALDRSATSTLYRHRPTRQRGRASRPTTGPRTLQRLVPLAGDNVVGGVPSSAIGGHANPQRTVQAYAWAMQDHGGRIAAAHDGAPGSTGRRPGDGGSDGSRRASGCDALVIAAGPQTGVLAAMIGVDVPMAPARAEMIVTEPLPLMPHRRRRRQRPLWPPDAARQPRLWRRPA